MRVFLFTSVPMTPPWDQGDKNLAYMLTRALPRVDFHVLTTMNGEAPAGANLHYHPVYQNSAPDLWQKGRVFYRLLQMQQLGNEIDPPADLNHLIYRPYRLSSRFIRLLPELRKRPSVHTVPATADQRHLGRELFFARKVVTVSEYGRRKLMSQGLQNVVHIPTGIKISDHAMTNGRGELAKSTLGIGGRPTVLYPGHYAKGMGSDLILKALPKIVARVPDAHLILACRNRSVDDQIIELATRKELENQGLIDHVSFFNTVQKMETLIAASDVMALPLEVMRDKIDIPTSLLEFLAAGKPIVITDIPPMNEIFELPNGSRLGMRVPAGDVNALVQAVVSLLIDPSQRAQMGEIGRRLVNAHFDIRKVAQQYEWLYQETIY